MDMGWLRCWAVGALIVAGPAQAALGGPASSVERDRAHYGATVASVATRAGRAAMIQPSNGGTIHEYSNADGIVYAVTWRSQGRPDLRQLLGDSFAIASADMAAQPGRRAGRLMTVARPDLVIRSQGRPGAFFGVAWDPRLVPAGFSPDALQ